MSLAILVILLAAAGAQDLYIQPADCREVTPARTTDQHFGEISANAGFQTCPPEGSARHIFAFDGFEGERVSFQIGNGSPSGASDDALNLRLTVSGPGRYEASGTVRGAAMLLTLPATGRYQLVVQNEAPTGMTVYPYYLQAREYEAMPPRRYDDCSRMALPGGEGGLEIRPGSLRPGGSTDLRTVWRMRGQTYEARPECFADWSVSTPEARLTTGPGGQRTLIVSPGATRGSRIVVNATAGGRSVTATILIETDAGAR